VTPLMPKPVVGSTSLELMLQLPLPIGAVTVMGVPSGVVVPPVMVGTGTVAELPLGPVTVILPVEPTGMPESVNEPSWPVVVVIGVPLIGLIKVTVAPGNGSPVLPLMTVPDTPPVGTRVMFGISVVVKAVIGAGTGALAEVPGANAVMLPVELTGKLRKAKVPLGAVVVVAVVPVTGSVYVTVAPAIGSPVEELMITPEAPPVGDGVGTREIFDKAVVPPAVTTAGTGTLAVVPGAEAETVPVELTGSPAKA